MPLPEMPMAHEQFQSCISACEACADACDRCATACLQEASVQELARCIRLDLDCAALCRVAVGSMARGSELAPVICEACERACEACAEECGRHMMDHCQRCAEACQRCAEECRRMAQGLGRAGHQEQVGGAPAH
jgi:hypothetical protein